MLVYTAPPLPKYLHFDLSIGILADMILGEVFGFGSERQNMFPPKYISWGPTWQVRDMLGRGRYMIYPIPTHGKRVQLAGTNR